MNLGVCALIGVICTAMALAGWPFAFRFLPALPEVSFLTPNVISIAALVLFVLIIVICTAKRRSTGAKVVFFLFAPLFAGVAWHFGRFAGVFFGEEWWKAILAAGIPLVLILIGMVILNAMDVDRHGFAFWVAIIFFVGIAIGLYFLLKQWIGEAMASLFSTSAWIGVAFTNSTIDFFSEY